MLSKHLPTGTVSPDGSTTRTFPRDSEDGPPNDEAAAQRVRTVDNRVDTLRDENELLREQNARLRAQLDAARNGRQDVIDRYERVLTDVRDTSTSEQTRRQSVPGWRFASLAGLVGGLLGRLFSR